jgi:oligoendopeptidase F
MRPLSAALATLSLAVPALAAAGAATTRSDVPDQYKWKLAELYPSDEAWTRARDGFGAKIEAFAKRRGHLGDGPRAMGDVLSQLGALHNELDRIRVYAQSRNDEDMREAGPRGMRAEAESLGVKLGAASSWVRPELLALPAGKIKAALAAEPRLKDWRFYLQDVLRWKPHTLPADEERLVSMAQELAGAPATTFNVLANADLPYPTVQLSTGESIRLDSSGYEKARRMADRGDRLKVFKSFFGALKQFEATDGTTLYAALQGHIFEQQAHRFGSTLEAALFRDAIPTAVYHQLVKDVNGNLGTLHRYLALRKRMMGLDQLGYEDLYTPLVKGIDRSYAIGEAQAMVLSAVTPLGPDYQSKLRHGYESGWTDFLPSTGKRSGAYSTGVYGIHPYQLLNFNGSWIDVSTLAHESGHSMHTLLSFESQPYPTSEYAIFVAEVASTLNENLLFHQALSQATADAERLSLLGQHLELLRGTLFRQTMFAEFELAIHERAEKGEALTGEKLSQLYLGIVRHYYGHDQGVCNVDAAYGVEWAFIPHFYYDYYVYQYATSVIASTALAKSIRDEESKGSSATRDRYLKMLSSGGSDYPVDLLKRAGVDMTTSAPFQAAMADMNETMDQMEAILGRQAKGEGK